MSCDRIPEEGGPELAHLWLAHLPVGGLSCPALGWHSGWGASMETTHSPPQAQLAAVRPCHLCPLTADPARWGARACP